VCSCGDYAPVLIAPGNQSSIIGRPDTLQLQGSDPDGAPVTYAVSGLPAGLSLMPSTGLIAGTPTTPQTVTVTATVSDGVLSTARSFGWTVQAPIAFAGLTADRVAPQPANTPITFTAAATGGASPYQYRWWVHDGTSWQMVRDWAANPAFTWTPSTANSAYRVNVWIKEANSNSASFDVDGSMKFPITAPLQVTLSADRTAPQTWNVDHVHGGGQRWEGSVSVSLVDARWHPLAGLARLVDKPHIHLDAADSKRRVSDQCVGQERGFRRRPSTMRTHRCRSRSDE
jgi:hypothetical protein